MIRTEIKPQVFTRMTQIDPDLFTLISAEATIDFPSLRNSSAALLKRSIPVMLTTDGFFRAAGGHLVRGRVFSREESNNGESVAVITSGLARTLWGSSDSSADTVFIDGRRIAIIGMWEFQPDTLEENNTLIMPLSLGNLVASMDYTPVTRFIIQGEDSDSLDRLKRVLDQVQLSSIGPVGRPEFRVISPPATGKNAGLWKMRKIPTDLAIFLLAAFVLILNVLGWDRAISQNSEVIAWRRWITNDIRKVRNQIFQSFLTVYYLWLATGLFIAVLTLKISKLILHLQVPFFLPMNLSLVVILLLVPAAIAWVTDLRVRKDIRLGRWL